MEVVNHIDIPTQKLHRRGKEYTLYNGSKDLAQNPDEVIHGMVDDLSIEISQMVSSSRRKANIYLYIEISIKMLLAALGVTIGILGIKTTNPTQNYIASALGFLITGLMGLSTTFNFSKRSVFLISASDALQNLGRKAKLLQVSTIPVEEKLAKLESIYAQVDKLDLDIFDNTVTTMTAEAATNISPK